MADRSFLRERAEMALRRLEASDPARRRTLWIGCDGKLRRGRSDDMVQFLEDMRVPTVAA